jgi:hypothetical protein
VSTKVTGKNLICLLELDVLVLLSATWSALVFAKIPYKKLVETELKLVVRARPIVS